MKKENENPKITYPSSVSLTLQQAAGYMKTKNYWFSVLKKDSFLFSCIRRFSRRIFSYSSLIAAEQRDIIPSEE